MVNNTSRQKVFSSDVWLQPRSSPKITSFFLNHGKTLNFPKNTLLVSYGSIPSKSYYMIGGLVRYSFDLVDGTSKTVSLVTPGRVIFTSAVLEAPSPLNAEIIAPSTFLVVDSASLRNYLKANPELEKKAYKIIINLLNTYIEGFIEIVSKSVEDRFESLLRALAKDGEPHSDGYTQLPVKISQEFVASMLSISRVTANKLFMALKNNGTLIKKDQYYCVQSTFLN